MLKRSLIVASFVALAGCGGGSSDPAPETPGNPTPPVENPPNNNPDNIPDPVTGETPVPGTSGNIYTGESALGSTVFVIDANQNLFGFANASGGGHFSVFGKNNDAAAEIRFSHRASDNPSLGDSFTIVGDLIPGSETIALSLAVTNDGQSLNNTGGPGDFSLTLADNNDMPAMAVSDVVGTWVARTAFCATCPLVVSMTFTADGSVSGTTKFALDPSELAAADEVSLTGTISTAGQYLNIQFVWGGKTRTGVIYRDTTTSKIVLNTVGFESVNDGDRSFSGLFTRQ